MAALAAFMRAVDAQPELVARLGDGAPAGQIAAFRAELTGVDWDVASDLLALHAWRDGARVFYELPDDDRLTGPTMNGMWLRSLRSIASRKRDWDELLDAYEAADPADRDGHPGAAWHRAWLPFLESDNEVMVLATVPCFGGPAGQVIRFDFKGSSSWWIDHESFDDWLRVKTAIVEAGLAGLWPHQDLDNRLDGFRRTPRRIHPLYAQLGAGRFDVQASWVERRA